MMCENDKFARSVLRHNFPEVELAADVVDLAALPDCDLVTAGWPCQDISQAGNTRGISGDRSGLVSHVFRLIGASRRKPQFVLLENVAFALHLRGGEAVRYVTARLEDLGYRWAYRILDSRLFGLPQRRRRLYVLASLDHDPADILLAGCTTLAPQPAPETRMVGFYWTEGNRGLGWTPDATPPLKGGSALGIPSPPAIWDRGTGSFLAPGIEDAERLQGFPANWTSSSLSIAHGQKRRWSLIGNAVSVPVAAWIGHRLGGLRSSEQPREARETTRGALPRAAHGGPGRAPRAMTSLGEGPEEVQLGSLNGFGLIAASPVSQRAIGGFTRRFEVAPLAKDPLFLRDLRRWSNLTAEAAE